MDGGGKFTGREFAEFCNAVSIRREYTTPGTPIRNEVVESAIWRTFKGGYAARRYILSNPHVDLSAISNTDPYGHRLWLASVIWASDCSNRSTNKANRGWLPPNKILFGWKPPLEVVPFSQEEMMRVKRTFNSDVQSVKCFFPHGANNHSTSTVLVFRVDTGRVCHTNKIGWIARGTAVMLALVPTIGGGYSVAATSRAAASTSPTSPVSFRKRSSPPQPRTSFND